ncbi:hypothetical protein L249_2186 [Ophiocordyceps polyrhachis-furcata BCC 54312]|uniref:Uncharacterized protein n=1 Tax=Ophiocordyceps polyrhachis-furcata BCC 54312 TaxID=1330021 RepID=A0A367LR37_9HYPO|nr:hypothetical protein L249_2186 [Ophiocordyceps polyrhachis-furcata BCC 54312]
MHKDMPMECYATDCAYTNNMYNSCGCLARGHAGTPPAAASASSLQVTVGAVTDHPKRTVSSPPGVRACTVLGFASPSCAQGGYDWTCRVLRAVTRTLR